MRFMVMIKSNPEDEANQMPSEQMLAEMTAYNEELARAGVMLSGEGFKPSSEGARVIFTAGGPEVLRGPFTDGLIAGFWILQAKSLDECIEWVKRVPMSGRGTVYTTDPVIEIRPIQEMDDFGAEFTPELRQREAALARQTAANARA